MYPAYSCHDWFDSFLFLLELMVFFQQSQEAPTKTKRGSKSDKGVSMHPRNREK
jgi:hypothetical protein